MAMNMEERTELWLATEKIALLERRVAQQMARIKELEGGYDQFEAFFGHALDYGRLVLTAEVTEQAIGVRDRWEKLGADQETWDALDDFCKAVNAMEGEEQS